MNYVVQRADDMQAVRFETEAVLPAANAIGMKRCCEAGLSGHLLRWPMLFTPQRVRELLRYNAVAAE